MGRRLIGIDASRAVTTQPTGTETYSQQLIRALIHAAPDHRFRLYFNQTPTTGLFKADNVEARPIPFGRLWTHARLSLEVALHAPDVLFVPAHVLPLVHPHHSVVTIHDLGYLHFPNAHPRLQRWYLDVSTRWNARAAMRLIADSQATKDDLIRHYQTPAEKIVVAYPGLDPNLRRVDDPLQVERVKSKYGIEGDYLLYLGTLQPRKNLSRLIKAYSRAKPDCKLVIAGKKGWLHDSLFKQVERLGLSRRVIFPGYAADADKAALLSGAIALTFPSLYEGFGLPVIEAMACGTPVVCSQTSALEEVAGDAALLVDPTDTDDIAAAIRYITSNSDLRRTLADRGYAQASTFTWQACARVVLEELTR